MRLWDLHVRACVYVGKVFPRSSNSGRTPKQIVTIFSQKTFGPIFFRSMDSTCPQDVGLPYMTGGRRAPDTLFLVAEGDFRFQRDHCVASRD